jgi:hypothetical protein
VRGGIGVDPRSLYRGLDHPVDRVAIEPVPQPGQEHRCRLVPAGESLDFIPQGSIEQQSPRFRSLAGKCQKWGLKNNANSNVLSPFLLLNC